MVPPPALTRPLSDSGGAVVGEWNIDPSAIHIQWRVTLSASPLEISVCGGTAVDHRQIVKETPSEGLSGLKGEEEVQEQILAPNLFVLATFVHLPFSCSTAEN